MVYEQALQKAHERWGKNGHAWTSKRHCRNNFKVGFLDSASLKLRIRGKGRSWEDAFADADASAKRKGAVDGNS